MIRRVHTFQYYKKTFRAWELTVEDYIYYLLEPEEAIKKILLEFNKNIPDMSETHMKNFLDILFDVNKTEAKSKKEKKVDIQDEIDDMHYFVFFLAKQIKQPLDQIYKMTFKTYRKTMERLDEILDSSKFIKSSEKWKPDKKWLRDVKNIISKNK